MSVTAGIGKLRDSTKALRQQWIEVQTSWRDENARQFYENNLEPLLTRIRSMELAMAQMATTIQQARRDCE